MDMICHQNIGMNRTSCTLGIFPEPVEIKQIIFFGKKTGLVIIPTLNDMEWNIGHNDSGSSWHKTIDTISD